MAVRVLKRMTSVAIATAKPLVMAAWTGAAIQPKEVTECIVALAAEAKLFGRAALLVAVHPSTPLPTEETRMLIQTEIKRLYPYLACGATVIARDGFAGSAQRAVVSTLQLLSRAPHPEKTVATARQAGEFLAAEFARAGGSGLRAEEVVAAFDEVTRAVWLSALLP